MEAATVGGPSKNLIQIGVRGAQAEEGHQLALSIVTFQRGLSGAPTPFVAAARQAGLTVHVLTERRRFDSSPARQLKELTARVRPDIIQSHNIKSHLFVRATGLHKLYPWVAFQHGYTATDLKDQIYNQVDRWTLRAAHRVVAVCQAFADRLEARGIRKERIRVQHNSVRPFEPPPAEVTAELRKTFGLEDHLVILAVGRLSREKGHADLLQAAAQLRKQNLMPWKLLLVGDGPEQANLEAQRKALGLESEVVFAGHQTDVRPFYAAADLLALPSHTEGSPNVVLESMAAGVPVAGCAVGGVPEILIDNETGLLSPAHDPAALAGNLARLIEEEPLRRKLAATAWQEAGRYSPENQYRALLSTYDELLSERG